MKSRFRGFLPGLVFGNIPEEGGIALKKSKVQSPKSWKAVALPE